jgi:hypothetical protein
MFPAPKAMERDDWNSDEVFVNQKEQRRLAYRKCEYNQSSMKTPITADVRKSIIGRIPVRFCIGFLGTCGRLSVAHRHELISKIKWGSAPNHIANPHLR